MLRGWCDSLCCGIRFRAYLGNDVVGRAGWCRWCGDAVAIHCTYVGWFLINLCVPKVWNSPRACAIVNKVGIFMRFVVDERCVFAASALGVLMVARISHLSSVHLAHTHNHKVYVL